MPRPPKKDDERLSADNHVRMSAVQQAFIERAAQRAEEKPSPFLRTAGLLRASKVLGEPIPGEAPTSEADSET
ncbi:hypothetical protein ACF1AJ_19315 [Leifsonia sp. NPDC014704]|uniref:Uncharacterized protein n=1 Tax=Leifsonia virtsii TaxID=3035915 RepID=A0ABT8J2G2_9MICO|nr:hypothetical protein [Leifsonia virtsii]MDN4599271.1 hypothetical protein [Leifsonia virtsii]